MPIVASLQVRGFPARAYLHDGGIEAYGEEPIAAAEEHLMEALQSLNQTGTLQGFPYSVCILWADKGDRIVDVVRYQHDMLIWPGNPEADPGVVRAGWWTMNGPKTCGDGIILLGEEERMRRTTGSLDEYLAAPNVLDKL
ncbi:hypothetical protein HOE91_04480 [archaeon]|jgi:hypothetical protein|nr:hypothetical protein [archaeon]